MSWNRAALQQPKAGEHVIGVVRDKQGRRSIHVLIWDGTEWLYAFNRNSISRFGHTVMHWMPLPELPADNG